MDDRVLGYLEGNRKWAESKDYNAPLIFKDMQRKGREREDGTVIVVACTDPRTTPEEYLGMSTAQGNKATIVRVAGGRVAAAMSSLLVLSAVGNLGKKGIIMVVHHTDCGLGSTNDEEIRAALLGSLEKGREEEGKALVKGVKFGSIETYEKSLKEDVEILRHSPFFTGMQIYGLLQDTESGLLEMKFDPSNAV